jgi:hypothetical protein
MFKYLVSRHIYPLLACALLFHTHAAQAGSVSTVTITSASGFAYFGGGPRSAAESGHGRIPFRWRFGAIQFG